MTSFHFRILYYSARRSKSKNKRPGRNKDSTTTGIIRHLSFIFLHLNLIEEEGRKAVATRWSDAIHPSHCAVIIFIIFISFVALMTRRPSFLSTFYSDFLFLISYKSCNYWLSSRPVPFLSPTHPSSSIVPHRPASSRRSGRRGRKHIIIIITLPLLSFFLLLSSC